MRIVHIITRLIVGGAQENTILSCQGQHARGHEVTLLTGPSLGPEGSLMESAAGQGYRIEVIDSMRRSIMPGKDYAAYRHLTARLRELKPDIVHTHSSKAGIVGRWAAHRAGAPCIIHTIHGLAFTASKSGAVNYVYKSLERRTAKVTTKIVCVADAMAKGSLEAGIGRPDQYVTVYSGMETGPFLNPAISRSDIRQSLGFLSDHVVVGTIARLFHLKGHDDILNFAPEAVREISADFGFFGWRETAFFASNLSGGWGNWIFRDRFVFTGLVGPDRIPELAGAMDILLHPSRREGLARAIVQGQLAGCPAVAYDIDGNREGLIEGKTGFAIAPFDQAAMESRLAMLAADEGLRRQMGEAGRRFAMERFDAEVMVDALEKVYRNSLQ